MASDLTTALSAAFVASILTTVGSRWVAGFQAKRAADQWSTLSGLETHRTPEGQLKASLKGQAFPLSFPRPPS